jgi:phosphatidylinositol-3-phosphatase
LQSNVRYNHFSLLKTVEAGFKLPCLNHACDSTVAVMADLFQKGKADGDKDGDDH